MKKPFDILRSEQNVTVKISVNVQTLSEIFTGFKCSSKYLLEC